jgi:hypothetical protein
MIDPKSFRTFNPHVDYNPHVHKQLDHTSLTDDQYMICTPVVLGYCFGIKKWGTCHIYHTFCGLIKIQGALPWTVSRT